VARKIPAGSLIGCGGFQRNDSTGGWAKGIPRNIALPLGVHVPSTLVRPKDTVGGACAAGAGAIANSSNPTPSPTARDFTYETANVRPQ